MAGSPGAPAAGIAARLCCDVGAVGVMRLTELTLGSVTAPPLAVR